MNKLNDSLLTLRGVLFYEKFLKRSQFFSEEEIKNWKKQWLSALLKHCRDNIPWYSKQFREYGVRADSEDPFFELKKLPILTKEIVRKNHADFCLANASKSLSFSTSGTSGRPITHYTSANQWIIEQGIIWRSWKWAGYKFRDKIAIFRSYTPLPNQLSIKVDRLRNWTYFSVFRMSDSSIDSYVNYLKKWNPKFLRGYPSSLRLVAKHAIENKWNLPSLKGAFTASEMISDDLRELLMEAFGIAVFDHYGQAEITSMFHNCEKTSGLHLDWEYGDVELIHNDQEDTYRIISTNLHNLAMPLLRYDTGDLSKGKFTKCKCNRTSPVIDSIYGRKDDYLIALDGSKMSTINLYTYFSKIVSVDRFQLFQEKPGELEIIIRFKKILNENEASSIKEKIEEELSLKTGLKVLLSQSKEFMQLSEGKLPTFIQRYKSVN